MFLYAAGMSLTKLSMAGNNLIVPGQEEFGYSDVPAWNAKIVNHFTVYVTQPIRTHNVLYPAG